MEESSSVQPPPKAPLSFSATRIIELANDPEVSLLQLVDLVEQDPGLAVRVLAMVNSSLMGLPHSISNVRRAATMLGVRGLKNLALSVVLSDMAPRDDLGRLMMTLSLRRAVASRLVAKVLGGKDLDEHFTAGLVLELWLISLTTERPEHAQESAQTPGEHRQLMEVAAGRETHSAAGARLIRQLGLSPDLAEAVLHHHDPDPPTAPLARSAWAAERLSWAFEGGSREHVLEELTRKLVVSADELTVILDDMPKMLDSTAKSFDAQLRKKKTAQAPGDIAQQRLLEIQASYDMLVRRLQAVLDEKAELARQLHEATDNLARAARTDPQTQLHNKQALEETLVRELARAGRSEGWVSLVVVVIDGFRELGDRHGYRASDDVIHVLGRLLREYTRGGDLIARYGGDEFMLLLPNTDPDGSRIVAERIRAGVEGRDVPLRGGATIQVTASVGAAALRGPKTLGRSDDLISRAHQAVREAQEGGGNRVAVRMPALTDQLTDGPVA